MIRRLQKTFNTTRDNCIREGDRLDNELDVNYQPIRRYIYGADMDDVEAHVELSEVTGSVFDTSRKGWYTCVKDQVGTVYKVYSDYHKQIVDTRTYDTFGYLISKNGSSNGNPGFQGKYFDNESGLYYFYNRYCNPGDGRFINEDPIHFGGGLNFYQFAINNPVNNIDPFGLWNEMVGPGRSGKVKPIWDQIYGNGIGGLIPPIKWPKKNFCFPGFEQCLWDCLSKTHSVFFGYFVSAGALSLSNLVSGVKWTWSGNMLLAAWYWNTVYWTCWFKCAFSIVTR